MLLSSFRVFHQLKGVSSGQPPETLSRAFFLDSCQRRLWVTLDSRVEAPGLECFEGEDAYEFLLRVACGLESQVIGETDVFGQLKEAWRVFSNAGGREASSLSPWFQKLFEDTKEIRTRFLHSSGGSTYGSLVRKVLPSRLQGPVLLIGAGRLAADIAPYIAEFGIQVLNRSAVRTEAMISEVREKCPGVSIQMVGSENERQVWSQVGAVIMCVPYGTKEDQIRQELSREYGGKLPILHLGGLCAEAGAWNRIEGLEFLDALFALEKSQGDLRRLQAERAFRACADRSKLRNLGASVSIPHGWEDLALFA